MPAQVHHQPNFATDLLRLWLLPWELGAEWAAAAAQLIGAGLAPAQPHAQLPLPAPIAAHDEHGLFA